MSKSNIITDQDIVFDIPFDEKSGGQLDLVPKNIGTGPLKTILADVEKEVIVTRLQKFHGNVAKVAHELEVGKTAFYDKLKKLNINPKDHR